MRQLPPLAAVRAFEAAARHRNYTRAGEELGLTQAGVSYQIKSFEQRVGTVLFVREGRAMALTPAGEALAQRVSQAFATMESAFAALAQTEDQVLSIACFQTFATKILAPRLGSFQLAHPEIAVRLVVSDAFVDLEAGECDLAIRLSRDAPTGLQVHRLNKLGIAPFASPAFVEANGELQAGDPPIAEDHRISPNNAWWREWDDARCASRDGNDGQRQPRGLEFDSQQLDAAAAISGNGIAILAPTLFLSEVTDGRLVRVGTRVVRPGGYFRLLYPEVRRHSPKVRAFRHWLERELEPCLAADPGCLEGMERA
ncbi:LysR substrate-binding domain-containing protein [Citromicrobium bathyomarinum]|uniref:LysR substrate-binding domain-containing protein n=1 Tax=Citromicrobium bathyomarinum TaxID=72174 RepID=UPI00315B2A1D